MKDKLQHFCENLFYAAKVNLALGLVLRNVEVGKNRYLHVHEKNLILERSQMIANKEDMLELQNILDDLYIIDLNTRERSSARWKFLFATNVTNLAALLDGVFVGCKDDLLPPRLVKRTDVNCLT